MDSAQNGSLTSVPNGRLIDFEIAEIRRVPFQDSLYLWVRGRLPASGFEANLAPRLYHRRPDYWAIEVVAIAKQAAQADQAAPNDAAAESKATDNRDLLIFEQSIPLIGIVGSRGITVIGASNTKQINLSSNVS